MSLKSIGIVNAFGGNRGDEAMLAILVQHLNARYPEMAVTLYAHKWVHLDGLDVTLKVMGNRLRTRPHRIISRIKPWRTLRRVIAGNERSFDDVFDHNFIISAPAGPYFGDLYQSSEDAKLIPLAIAARKNIPFCILATSAGPYSNRRLNKWRRHVLNSARFWTVREGVSFRQLHKLSLSTEISEVTDLVFAKSYPSINEMVPHLHRSEYRSVIDMVKSCPTILVTLNITKHMDACKGTTDFNIESYIGDVVRLLIHVRENTGAQILLIPHFYGDLVELRMFSAIQSNSALCDGVYVLPSHYNHHAQAELYRYAVFAISHRYHPTIFAAKARCPFLCIRHQFKADGMMDYLNNPGVSVDSLSGIEKWIEAFDETWANRTQIRHQLECVVPEVEKRSRVSLECLDVMLEKGEPSD